MPAHNEEEIFISVDVETAGPHPAGYALLTIGACLVSDPDRTFYVELQPDRDAAIPEALKVTGLSMTELAERGLPPADAMTHFEAWVNAIAPPPQRAIFVAFNAPFDWMFVNDYFQRYLGRNPFGHSALDLKALYMGLTGVSWAETSMRFVSARYLEGRTLTHHALKDARDQADLFRAMMKEAKTHGWTWL
jgi:ribonuclease T